MSEQKLQVCRFCERNIKLAYYCEECGASCCSDCLNEEKIDSYMCQMCDSKNIEIQNGNIKKICKDCGSDKVMRITQNIKSCPKCHSHKIINIYEKKEELEQKFLELIKETRSFVSPIRDIINKLFILEHKIKKAREPPVRCYHYPQMESDLLALFKLAEYLKSNLLEKINLHFKYLTMNKEYFFDIHAQPNSNLRIIEGILENLSRSFDSIKEFINHNLKAINERIDPFQKNLKFLDKIKSLFATYKRCINLAEDEKPVYAIKAKLANGLNTQDAFKKTKGILFVTDLDLSFVHGRGLIKKSKELIFKAPVKDLIKVKDIGKVFKKLYIEFAYGKYEFSLPSKTIPKVIEYVLLAKDFEEKAIFDGKAAQDLLEIDLDLNDLVNFIEEGINSFFSIKCQYNNKVHTSNSRDSERIYDRKNQPSYESDAVQQQRSQYPSNSYSYSSDDRIYNRNGPYYATRPYPQYVEAGRENSPYYRPQPRTPIYYERMVPEFYPQNLYNPNMLQNYEPNYISNSNRSYDDVYRSQVKRDLDFDERNLLMKKLERVQKTNPEFLASPLEKSMESSINDPLNDSPQNLFESELNSGLKPESYQSFTKNHLNRAFNFNKQSSDDLKENSKGLFGYNREKRKKMIELKREQFVLNETLKNLEEKFDQGIISEADYFRTYKNLQKEQYMLDQQLKELSEKYKDEELKEKTRKNVEGNRYFS